MKYFNVSLTLQILFSIVSHFGYLQRLSVPRISGVHCYYLWWHLTVPGSRLRRRDIAGSVYQLLNQRINFGFLDGFSLRRDSIATWRCYWLALNLWYSKWRWSGAGRSMTAGPIKRDRRRKVQEVQITKRIRATASKTSSKKCTKRWMKLMQ